MLSSGGVGKFDGEGKGKFGDGEEVELGGGAEEGVRRLANCSITCRGRGSITRNCNGRRRGFQLDPKACRREVTRLT